MATVATLRDLISALIETSVQAFKLSTITSDIEKFFSLMQSNGELKNIFSSSAYNVEEKVAVISDISKSISLDSYTENFVKAVIEMDKFKGFINSQQPILRRLRKAAGIELAEFIFAQEPSQEEISNVQSAVEAQISNKIEVTVIIDPEILGGVIVKVSNRLFDNSIKTKLNKVKNMLIAA